MLQATGASQRVLVLYTTSPLNVSTKPVIAVTIPRPAQSPLEFGSLSATAYGVGTYALQTGSPSLVQL